MHTAILNFNGALLIFFTRALGVGEGYQRYETWAFSEDIKTSFF